MVHKGLFAVAGAVVALFCAGLPATADTYPVIVQGKVTLEDGSPPPFIVSIERICTPSFGDAPGPLTNKKGEWLWRLEIDPFNQRSCVFRAHHDGWVSSVVEESGLNQDLHNTTVTVAPIVIAAATADPYTIHTTGDEIPGKAKGPFNKAMKALDAHKYDEALSDLEAAVTAAPKFAEGWHAIGVVNDTRGQLPAAKEAYTHAIEADPRQMPSYVTLTRLCIKTKDWQCAQKTADGLVKLDTKHVYPEIYLHRAVAEYELKDLAAAQQSVEELMKVDTRHKWPRGEYVLGRILEAKGDINGAREHMKKYLDLEATSKDAEQVQAHMLGLGKPDSGATEPDLEVL